MTRSRRIKNPQYLAREFFAVRFEDREFYAGRSKDGEVWTAIHVDEFKQYTHDAATRLAKKMSKWWDGIEVVKVRQYDDDKMDVEVIERFAKRLAFQKSESKMTVKEDDKPKPARPQREFYVDPWAGRFANDEHGFMAYVPQDA